MFFGCKNETEERKYDLSISSTKDDKTSPGQSEDPGDNPIEETIDEASKTEVDEYGLVEKRIEEFISAIDIGEGDFIELTQEDKKYLIEVAYGADPAIIYLI